MTVQSLASRVDAIVGAPATAQSASGFSFGVHCRQCRHDRYAATDLEIVAIENPTDFSVARVHTRCPRCNRRWTYTATCAPTPTNVVEAHDALERQAVA